MMPSFIPARLQFQCGHAALVTLPRVKGETAAQRNHRVVREKTAALGRQCDFCLPSRAVMEPQLAVMNDSQFEIQISQSDVVEPTPIANLALVMPNESESTVRIPVTRASDVDSESVPTTVEPAGPDVVEPEAPDAVIVGAIIFSHAEAVEQSQLQQEDDKEEVPAAPKPKPARGPRARRQQEPASTLDPSKRAQPRPVRGAPVGRARPAPGAKVIAQRFTVKYLVERVVRASTIHDALREMSARGAADFLAVTREG
jgi:hypothetical protein